MDTEPQEAAKFEILDFAKWNGEIGELAPRYRSASPFPHIVLDGFLDARAVHAAIEEFPPLDGGGWISYLHVNERKFSQVDPSTWGPTLRSILDEFNSPRFIEFLEQLTGIEGLFPDPSLEGGGLHQSTTAGYLNVHADFTVHPQHRDWRRRVNLLLYLNEDWRTEYGGELEFWDADMKHREVSVAPLANRVVVFTTDADSFHGHPEPMRCPPDRTRRSLALYYFSHEVNPMVRSTEYRARPGEGARSLLIYADKQALRLYDQLKRRLGLSDKLAGTLLARLERLRRRKPGT
jgi:2-oxoglutarate-Fe(II)-dependent oxygenase superfamily protein